MKKNIFGLFLLIINTYIAQVNFTNIPNPDSNANGNDQVMMYITNTNETSGVKGFGLPAVDAEVNLPYTGANAPATRIEELRGMLLFVKSIGQVMVFDGLIWTKAFEIESDNISRFQLNSVSTTSGDVMLSINSLINKANFLADPLKLKTNVPTTGANLNRLYIRQTGLYRINLNLNFTGSAGSFSDRLGAGLYVNDNERFQLLEDTVNFDGTNRKINLDFSVYAQQGQYITLEAISETGGTRSYNVTTDSYVTVEKIL
ncbi:hypothetical protein C1637_22780 [Chryseobacterium lactis]|uniref:Uncharacterized protein n=1 Tax=Chryseobacterium lactis TaxID=1241981 RepID=A0A3G6RVE7_CHRLC|nr:hypothetical protein [Chryseobacterium lactis]AZA80498.1 hypothetical protein EG342_00555 [Chryseobacterium lactis]AZB05500.1 hypothetical protein EG341_16680 [Chryseobacterium lactis]PNW11365.1 hypothetical protein C1637_22780 [Chryseobacterium lactis]